MAEETAEPKGPRSRATSRHRSECLQRRGQRGDSPSFAGRKSKEKHRSFDMSKYSQRQIALRHAPYRAARPTQPNHPVRTRANTPRRTGWLGRFAYLGWNYHGLASQGHKARAQALQYPAAPLHDDTVLRYDATVRAACHFAAEGVPLVREAA